MSNYANIYNLDASISLRVLFFPLSKVLLQTTDSLQHFNLLQAKV